jgi:hypothetical protein
MCSNMEKNGPRAPSTLKHTSEARTEADLQKEMRTYVAVQPGVRWLADVLTALHGASQPLRSPRNFYSAFPPRLVLQALSERADLRVRLVRAITGGAPTLLRRLAPADLAAQIELLVAEDLPATERSLRAEEDRSLSVLDLYLKYLDPCDLAAYLPVTTLWEYESHDAWWTRDAAGPGRALMVAELKSIRKHAVLSDSDILDVLGDETFERDLPVAVRTGLRAAARKAAREGRPFKDADLFASVRSADGLRDLTDELADHVPLPMLRKVIARAAEVLGFGKEESPLTKTEPMAPRTAATPAAPSATPPPARVPPAGKGGKPTSTPGGRAQAEPVYSRSKTQPVPTTEERSPFADEEVVGPESVVMIEEVPG